MAQTYLSQFLAAMRELEQQMTRLFGSLAAQAVREIMRHADAAGAIPIGATFEIQAAVGGAVTRMFLGPSLTGFAAGARQLAPFAELPDGTLFPLSPFSRSLLDSVARVEAIAIEQQRNTALRIVRVSPQAESVLRRTALFRPNPLAQFERAHTWVDPNGYRLSDRIWRTAGSTRRKLDAFLDDAIRTGRGVLDLESKGAAGIARDLEQFLMPGRTLRTRKPYGIDASYDAMRLARTEVARAHAAAFEHAADMNPFVTGIGVRLSGSHSKVDICDEAAAAGPWPKDAIPPQYQIPMHPMDMCTYYNVIAQNPAAVLEAML